MALSEHIHTDNFILEKIFSKDHSFAYLFSEIVLLVFGVFSIIHGACLVGILPKNIRSFVERKALQYAVYFTLGITTTLFYVLVLYTKFPIPKNDWNRPTYKLCLWFIGVFFIAVPITWELCMFIWPFLRYLSEETTILVITCILLGSVLLLTLCYFLIFKKNKDVGHKENHQTLQNVSEPPGALPQESFSQ